MLGSLGSAFSALTWNVIVFLKHLVLTYHLKSDKMFIFKNHNFSILHSLDLPNTQENMKKHIQ